MHFRFFRLSTSSDTVLLTATALLLLHFHSMTLHCYYTWEARNCIVVSSKNLGPNPFCTWWRCQPALTENSGAFVWPISGPVSKLVYKHVILYINQIMQVHAKILCLIFHDLSVHWKAFATVTSLSHETARCACTEKALDATSRSVHSAKASRQWLQWNVAGTGHDRSAIWLVTKSIRSYEVEEVAPRITRSTSHKTRTHDRPLSLSLKVRLAVGQLRGPWKALCESQVQKHQEQDREHQRDLW
jgi:hypothetical protein